MELHTTATEKAVNSKRYFPETHTLSNISDQFIQSYELSDDDIMDLVSSTMNELRDVITGDYRKAILFMKGTHLSPDKVPDSNPDFAKALMANPLMANDPFIISKVYQQIRKRIDEAKVGVLAVHGNYSIVCGDPYALCQNIFGLPVTGLLKAGEIYNEYWLNAGAEDLVCFRAPMTAHSNIRHVKVCGSDEARYWYQYMRTCTAVNAWDTMAQALNGMDKRNLSPASVTALCKLGEPTNVGCGADAPLTVELSLRQYRAKRARKLARRCNDYGIRAKRKQAHEPSTAAAKLCGGKCRAPNSG